MFIKSVLILVSVFSLSAFATVKPTEVRTFDSDHKSLVVPEVTVFEPADFKAINTKWKEESRKVASEMSFSESDLSPDFVKFRDNWLKVKNADQLQKLLDESYAKYDTYSPDVQYFLAQIHVMRKLRGIVWRMRPMFESGPFFGGNRATHVSAIQFVRHAATGMTAAFPHSQTDALIEYFTQPSKNMGTKDQFMNMYTFQSFLAQTYVPSLNEGVTRIKAIITANPAAVWKWDNKMFYGTGTFGDGINRIVGHGAAEMHVTLGGMYTAMHDAYVFSAYNQDASIRVAGNLGKALGVDGAGISLPRADIGLTDQERSEIVMKAVEKDRFLQLRNYQGTKYGNESMARAYLAKKNAVENFAEAYDKLKGKGANQAMALNPGIYQPEMQDRLGHGIENMRDVIEKKTEVRDPISGKTVVLDVPNFYKNPPESLKSLMATGWEKGENKVIITNKEGEKLEVRNYFSGRANAWNNQAWSKYVPSAQGKPAAYMQDARRTMTYSLGVTPVFGAPELFVR